MGKKSENGKNWPTHEPRYHTSTKISFIIAIQPFYGCQRNTRKNITITVSVRVSVTVRVSLVWFVSSNSFDASSIAICRVANGQFARTENNHYWTLWTVRVQECLPMHCCMSVSEVLGLLFRSGMYNGLISWGGGKASSRDPHLHGTELKPDNNNLLI